MSVRRYNEYEDDELESVGIFVDTEREVEVDSDEYDWWEADEYDWLGDWEVGYDGER